MFLSFQSSKNRYSLNFMLKFTSPAVKIDQKRMNKNPMHRQTSGIQSSTSDPFIILEQTHNHHKKLIQRKNITNFLLFSFN